MIYIIQHQISEKQMEMSGCLQHSELCKSDFVMMKSMNRHIMGNPRMKDSMEKRMTERQDSKAVEGLDKTTLTVTKKNQ